MNAQRHGMRKAALAGALALSLVLAACGGSASSSDDGAAASGAKLDVGTGEIAVPSNTDIAMVSQANNTLSYPAAYSQGGKDAAKKYGVKLDIYYANYDQGAEQSNWSQATTPGKYGGVLIHSLGGAALCKAVKDTTVKKQLLTLTFANPLCGQALEYGDDLWSPGTLTHIGGQNNAPAVEAVLNAAYEKHPGKKNILLVLGPPDHASTLVWVAEVKKFLVKHPEWTINATLNTDFTPNDAFKQTQNQLQANSDVDLAFTQYIDSSIGVAKALDEAGLTKDTPLYEYGGGSEESVKLIKAGKLEGSFPSYPYSAGYAAVEAMAKAFDGEQPDKFIPFDGNPDGAIDFLVTPENVDDFTPEW